MKTGQRATRVALVSLALFAGAAGVAYATQTLAHSASTQIIACQLKAIGTLRVVSAASACTKFETVLTWSTQGSAVPGPAGPAGPTGATGPAGKDGADGTNGVDGAVGPQGPKGDTGAQGPQGAKGDTGAQGPKGDPGSGGGLASFDGVNGLPCNNGTGTMQVSYNAISGGASLTCQPSTYYTLTLKVSGGTVTTVPPPFGSTGGPMTVYHPVSVNGSPGISCEANPDNTEHTCLYRLPAGTAVIMTGGVSGGQSTWSDTPSFTLTGDTTRTFTFVAS